MTPTARNVARWVWFPLRVTVGFLMRNGKRILVTIAGLVLLLAGLVMMVTPGPGILLILAGLAVLASEYVWAQRMLNYARRKAEQAKDKVLGRGPHGSNEPGADG
ncbi:MAG: PGPGW domain-containing protein [Actinomycetota bacterium]